MEPKNSAPKKLPSEEGTLLQHPPLRSAGLALRDLLLADRVAVHDLALLVEPGDASELLAPGAADQRCGKQWHRPWDQARCSLPRVPFSTNAGIWIADQIKPLQ